MINLSEAYCTGCSFHALLIKPYRYSMIDKFSSEIKSGWNGIQTLIHYPIPRHKQLAYKEWNSISLSFTEQIHREVLSLLLGPVMALSDVKIISNIINGFES